MTQPNETPDVIEELRNGLAEIPGDLFRMVRGARETVRREALLVGAAAGIVAFGVFFLVTRR